MKKVIIQRIEKDVLKNINQKVILNFTSSMQNIVCYYRLPISAINMCSLNTYHVNNPYLKRFVELQRKYIDNQCNLKVDSNFISKKNCQNFAKYIDILTEKIASFIVLLKEIHGIGTIT